MCIRDSSQCFLVSVSVFSSSMSGETTTLLDGALLADLFVVGARADNMVKSREQQHLGQRGFGIIKLSMLPLIN